MEPVGMILPLTVLNVYPNHCDNAVETSVGTLVETLDGPRRVAMAEKYRITDHNIPQNHNKSAVSSLGFTA